MNFSAKTHPFTNPIKIEEDSALFFIILSALSFECRKERKRKNLWSGNTDGEHGWGDRRWKERDGYATHMQIGFKGETAASQENKTQRQPEEPMNDRTQGLTYLVNKL